MKKSKNKKNCNADSNQKQTLWDFCKQTNPSKIISGVYRIWIEDDERCYSYIGQSSDIYKRLMGYEKIEHTIVKGRRKQSIKKTKVMGHQQKIKEANDLWRNNKNDIMNYYKKVGERKYKYLIHKLREIRGRVSDNIYFEILKETTCPEEWNDNWSKGKKQNWKIKNKHLEKERLKIEEKQIEKFDAYWLGFNAITKSTQDKRANTLKKNQANIDKILPKLNRLKQLHPISMKPYFLMKDTDIKGLKDGLYQNYEQWMAEEI